MGTLDYGGAMRCAVVISLALAGLLLVPATGQARPLILPVAKAKPGGFALLEVAAPPKARSCGLSVRARGGRREGTFRVRLGSSPTRFVGWKVPHRARGTWIARLSCRSKRRSAKGGRSLGASTRSIVVGRRGRGRGRLVRPGTLRVRPGSIPEMPAILPVQGAFIPGYNTPLSQDDVDTGREDEPFHGCSHSPWISSTRTTGEFVGTLVQLEPTPAARANAARNFSSYRRFVQSGSSFNPVYSWMWADLNRCAGMSANMTPEHRHSIYMQMACHARWGVTSRVGGNTWDLEAWRKDVDWARGLSFGGRCGRNYGYIEDAGNFLVGRIVNGRGRPEANPAEELKAWLVESGPLGTRKPVRRHVATMEAYDCLIKSGKQQASWFPFDYLERYLDYGSGDVSPDEVCPKAPAGSPAAPPRAPSAPAPQKPTPQQPAPPKPTATNLIVVVYGGGHVGVAFDVGWRSGRDPVTCHFFRDGVEVFTAQCGTRSSKQFYGVPAGTHRFYATVSDRFGVYSDPTNVVVRATN
jgi:hypothetical protein